MKGYHNLPDIRLRFPPVGVRFQNHKISGLELADNIGTAAAGIIGGHLRSRNNRKCHLVKETEIVPGIGFSGFSRYNHRVVIFG